MAQSLKGKVALVTGSTSGIGLAIAEGLAARGANIVLNGLGEPAAIASLQDSLQQKYPVRILFSDADLTRPEAIRQMITMAQETFGQIDILVNNAGIQFVAPIEDFPEDKWNQIIALNLSAAFHTSKAVIPLMIQNGWGRIINIASAHGLVASPFKSAYVAAKHGLVGLTKVIALEVAEKGITVNAICPGYVRTPLVEKQIADQAKAYGIPEERVIHDVLLKAQPNKKFIEARHLAELTAFLCSDAAEGMTGEIIAVDGGWTAQ
jgi:3-hydroxybutyrate dehydrogenase